MEMKFADVSSSKGPKKHKCSSPAPKWRMVRPGLSLEGKCTNSKCEANGKLVIVNKGFIAYDLRRDAYTNTCPICKEHVDVGHCFFNNCLYQYTGKKYVEKGKLSVLLRSQQKIEAGDEYCLYSVKKVGTADWDTLMIAKFPVPPKHKDKTFVFGAKTISEKSALLKCKYEYHPECTQLSQDSDQLFPQTKVRLNPIMDSVKLECSACASISKDLEFSGNTDSVLCHEHCLSSVYLDQRLKFRPGEMTTACGKKLLQLLKSQSDFLVQLKELEIKIKSGTLSHWQEDNLEKCLTLLHGLVGEITTDILSVSTNSPSVKIQYGEDSHAILTHQKSGIETVYINLKQNEIILIPEENLNPKELRDCKSEKAFVAYLTDSFGKVQRSKNLISLDVCLRLKGGSPFIIIGAVIASVAAAHLVIGMSVRFYNWFVQHDEHRENENPNEEHKENDNPNGSNFAVEQKLAIHPVWDGVLWIVTLGVWGWFRHKFMRKERNRGIEERIETWDERYQRLREIMPQSA